MTDRRTEDGERSFAYADEDRRGYGCCGTFLIVLSVLLWIILFPIAIWFSFKVIKEYERAIILRVGRIQRKNGKPIIHKAGVQFVLPCTDNFMRIDMRTKTMDIPEQDVLTADSVTCRVNATICLRTFDPAKALLRSDNAFESSYNMSIAILRDVIGQTDLGELLRDRDELDKKIERELKPITNPWGITVEKVGIKDVILPPDMRRAMAIEAEASRTARAKVIEARGELNSAEVLSAAAQQLEKQPSALHLRYLQTLSNISAEQNSTIIFPLPMEFLRYFNKNKLE